MAEEATTSSTGKGYAVVTGANKGIGFEVCRQLASHGITVVLTARDETRGIEAVDKLNGSGLDSGLVIFHQLDVTDLQSVASLAEFIKSQFGKLDILVNNAGIGAYVPRDPDAVKAAIEAEMLGGAKPNWSELMIETYDSTAKCLQTNYYGAKRTIEALLPLLQLSHSPRIVNVSSAVGKLKNIPSESIKGILNDVDNLTEEKINKVLEEFLNDVKEGWLEAKGWPLYLTAYVVSKVALNAYTRVLADKYPTFRINCVCPGSVRTDMTRNTGLLTAEEGAGTPVMAALVPDDGPTGSFIVQKQVSSFVE